MHDEFFAVGVDAVETATFGAFPLVLNEYGIADQTFEINRRAAADRHARSRPAARTPDRPRFVIGSIGPGHPAAVARPDPLRRRCATTTRLQVDGLLAGGVDVLLIETVYDLLQAKAAINGAPPGDGSAGRRTVPIMVQVTVETTGRMLVGSEIGAALTALEAMQPDVIGMNCATGPAEMTEHLRYLAQHARTFLSCLPNAGLPSVVDGHTHYDLTPDALADAHERFVDRVRAQHRRRLLRHHARAPRARSSSASATTARRSSRTPEFEPGCSSIYSHVPFHQELAYLAVGERTNANGSRKFRDAMLEADWDTCVQMAREQVKEGAHVLDVCVDYVGRDGTDRHGRDRRPLRDAGRRCRSCSTRPSRRCSKPACSTTAARRSSTRPTSKRARPKASAWTACSRSRASTAPPSSASPSTRRARPAPPTGSCGSRKRIYDIAIERYGIEPHRPDLRHAHVPALAPATTTSAATAMETIEAIRRIKAELPGASTILGLSNVVVRAQARGPPRAQQRVPARVPRGRARRRDRARGAHHADAPDRRARQREVALDLIYDRRRDDYDPLTEFMALFEGVEAGAIEQEDRSGWPVEERLKHRIIDGDRDGLEADLDEQLAVAARARRSSTTCCSRA